MVVISNLGMKFQGLTMTKWHPQTLSSIIISTIRASQIKILYKKAFKLSTNKINQG